MRAYRLWFVAATAAVLAVAAAADAAEKKGNGDKPDIREMIEPPSHVQLLPLSAPLRNKNPGTTPVTVYLGAVNKYDVGEICRRAPVVNDAILRELYADPIPVRNRMLVLDGIGTRLVAPINRALGRTLVKEVFIVAGAQSMGGGVVSKLPFGSSSGCTGIKDIMDRIEGKDVKKQSGKGKKK